MRNSHVLARVALAADARSGFWTASERTAGAVLPPTWSGARFVGPTYVLCIRRSRLQLPANLDSSVLQTVIRRDSHKPA